MEDKLDQINKKLDDMKQIHAMTIVVGIVATIISAIHLYQKMKSNG